MSLTLPTNAGQLLGLGNKMTNGLTLEGQALKITQITAAQLQAVVTAFANADNAFNAGRSARQAASDIFQAADGTLSDWLGVVRTVLAGRFGQRWSTVWAQAGFINNTTAIPSKIEDRIALAGRLVAFFTKKPTYEVASMGVTAAQGTALLNAITSAQNGLTASGKGLKTLEGNWNDAFKALTDMMWSLIKILQATLEDNDPMWLEFGLQMPGTPSTPGKPAGLVAHTDDTGAIVVQCDAVPLAMRYRWRMLLVGIESDYQLAASSPVPIGTITGVEPGRLVRIIVQAVNGSLQGVASEPLDFRMPPAQSSVPPRAVEAQVSAGQEVSSDAGHGNGLGLTHRMLPRVG